MNINKIIHIAIFSIILCGFSYASPILLKFYDSAERPLQNELIARSSAIVSGYIEEIKLWKLQSPDGKSEDDIINFFKSRPEVKYCYKSRQRHAFFTPNDTNYGSQWGLTSSNGINMENAWNTSFGLSSVIIAVIDTGVDYNHPDLKNKMWKSPKGYYGWDFVGNDNDPADDNGHGTHVSGIAAAETNNAEGIAGVAVNPRIMALKVLDSEGSGHECDEVEAIMWAVRNGARVINMSFGSNSYDPAESEACSYAFEKGVFIAAASGNDNFPAVSYPAALSTTFAVGAVNESGDRCSPSDWGTGHGSNYGPQLDVLAPGNDIMSTVPNTNPGGASNDNYDIWDISGYLPESGTSMACPFVAGLASIIFSIRPDYGPEDVAETIRRSGDNYTNFTNERGYGLINAAVCLAGLNEHLNNLAADVTVFPNPYKVSSGITMKFAFKAPPSRITTFRIFDFTGQEIRTLGDENFYPSSRLVGWDGKNKSGDYVSSGVYFYFAETDKGKSKGCFAIIK